MTKKHCLLIAVATLGVATTACADAGEDTATESENKDIVNESGFPIVKEPIELTFFTGKSEPNSNNFEETYVWKTYEEMTDMKINFELAAFDGLAEKRNLLFASGNYPDAFYSARLTASDLATYGEQGILIPLDDLIEEYAPNFKSALDKHPDLRKGLTMPDGHIYSFPSYYDPDFLPMLIGVPLWINDEWLDELGMERPTTTDAFYDYLTAVKNTPELAEGEIIPFSGTNMTEIRGQLQGAWGFGNRGVGHKFIDVDPENEGELRFFRTDPKYKEFLEYLNKLYTEELIDPEVYTHDSAQLLAKGAEGRIGAVITSNPETLMNQDHYSGGEALEGPHGDKLYSHVKPPLVHVGAFAITDKNEHPEATVRWIDYFFGEEGATFYFMGKEGETYTKQEDGSLEYTEEITDNPDGLTQDQALASYITWLGGSYPGYVQEHYFKGSESLPNSIENGEKAAANAPEEIWNAFNYTREEQQFRDSVGADLETFINETEDAFITGRKPLSEWDDYVAQVEAMGLEEYMSIQQAAYERYQEVD
ncbi:extracellular solute-binding protein [Shouchella clausii]|uniref:extracellular solute-binding protein n=1 Tax=Shouchella clausii TaxID=79880 RepID=UPI000BA59468|nr:extracellular solute-binding protein [Shouchella clausii]MCZ1181471.1 extracellular solute-binding protein [Shouchella clausii]PAD15074.1 ABC transporter substrate-binding protein [Shouchella clausii]